MLPELPNDIAADLPLAIAEAKTALQPGNPAEVLNCLHLLANRLNLALPDETALAFDIDIMTSWPRDLFRTAFRTIWETYTWRRLPTVGDFRQIIHTDLQDRRELLSRLEDLARKTTTRQLRQQWTMQTRLRSGCSKK